MEVGAAVALVVGEAVGVVELTVDVSFFEQPAIAKKVRTRAGNIVFIPIIRALGLPQYGDSVTCV
jgi:hypothetical protein